MFSQMFTITIALDTTKAFSTVNIHKLIHKIIHTHITRPHNTMTKLIANYFNPLNTASLAMYRGCGNQCDPTPLSFIVKKPLEGYDKDSERVHRWLPIEFINDKMKLRNHAERLSVNKKSVTYQIGLNNVFVSVIVEIFVYIRVYSTVILYEADGLRCRTINP